ncbi:MAG TPA: hypothetical protein VD932_03875 [Aquabacterium sp.]|nr:hypothetical protein [Aquabacterium sp.]
MKVIAKVREDEYVCTVKHSEIEKFLDLYYGNMKTLNVGQEVDLGKGHDHAAEIRSAMRATRELIEKHQPVVTAILNGLRIEAKAAGEHS